MMILELKDGGILDIRSDLEHHEDPYESGWGLDTYYKATYFEGTIFIDLTKIKMTLEASNQYNTPFYNEDLIKLLLKNVEKIKEMTEKQFVNWLSIEFTKVFNEEIKIKIK